MSFLPPVKVQFNGAMVRALTQEELEGFACYLWATQVHMPEEIDEDYPVHLESGDKERPGPTVAAERAEWALLPEAVKLRWRCFAECAWLRLAGMLGVRVTAIGGA